MKRPRMLSIIALLAATTACGETVTESPATTAQTVIGAPTTERSLASRIAPDERLHYIDVDVADHLGGKLEASTRVDIIAILPIEGDQPSVHVGVDLIQNVALLDVDVDDPEKAGQVGLSLTDDEVDLLVLNETRGDLLLLPRAAGDAQIHTVRKTSTKEALEDIELLAQQRKVRQRSKPAPRGPYPNGIAPDERAFVIDHGLPEQAVDDGAYLDVRLQHNDMTVSLLQRLRVLEVLSARRAIVSVTTEEAKMLALLDRQGELVFTVRNTEDIEVSAITKKTLRSVLQDLEVIQEKRQIRVRKKPRKKKLAKTIEIIRGDGSVASPPPAAPEPVQAAVAVDENDFTDPADDPFSTFAADVDTGSYTLTRGRIRSGRAVAGHEVRTEEFVNYFDYSYPQPESGAFSVSVDGAPSPFASDGRTQLLRIGIQGDDLSDRPRTPAHLTFLVDVSGSMEGDDRLTLAKKALRYLVNNLRAKDTVSIVTYSGEVKVALEPTGMQKRRAILATIGGLTAGGGTAMGDGMQLAYEQAARVAQRGHENRVVILSDGDANIGDTSWEQMLGRVSDRVKNDGIALSTIGFGDGNFRDTTMEQLANNGNGNYYYIDSFAEAKRVFGGHLDGTLRTIAKDVKLQVEFNPNAVSAYRQVGYENRAVADHLFRDDSVDAGEIGAGHQVTALYEVVMKDAAVDRIATVRVRHKAPEGSQAAEVAFDVDRSMFHGKLSDAPDDFQFAAAVATFAEVLRASKYAGDITPAWIEEVARQTAGNRPERREFLRLVRSWTDGRASGDFN